MDIYKYAEEYDYSADYYDMNSGRIYKITEAENHNGKIPVYTLEGEFLGFAIKK